MSKIVVINNLTLDGVTQAPGAPDEDPRDGFEHGGWAVPYSDDAMGRLMAEGTGEGGALLLGRRTYERFAGFWPRQPDNPFTPVLNRMQKYVASATLAEPLPWQSSTSNHESLPVVSSWRSTRPPRSPRPDSGRARRRRSRADSRRPSTARRSLAAARRSSRR